MLSPSSRAHPARKTSASTWSLPAAALEMTAPPYEWATRTIGPSTVCRSASR
jgi:hypothetical protein